MNIDKKTLIVGILIGMAVIIGCGAVTVTDTGQRYVWERSSSTLYVLDTQTGTVNRHQEYQTGWETTVLPFEPK